jgi:hypothetical protein
VQKILRLTHGPALAVVFSILVLAATGCSRHATRSKGIFLIMDAGETGAQQSPAIASSVNTLLAALVPGDTLLVGRTDADHRDQPDVILKTTFNQRPSVISAQKRIIRQQIFNQSTQATAAHPDGIAALLLAAQYLHQTPNLEKFILLLSDAEYAPADGQIPQVPLHMQGIQVIAVETSRKTDADSDPDATRQRMHRLQTRIESGGGIWRVIGDHDQLGRILMAAGQPG